MHPLKQYNDGGIDELLKIRYSLGKPRAIPLAIVTEVSTKISGESCGFKSYKEIGEVVKFNYQVSINYQTLHKHLRYGIKAKLKAPRRCSNKKNDAAAILV